LLSRSCEAAHGTAAGSSQGDSLSWLRTCSLAHLGLGDAYFGLGELRNGSEAKAAFHTAMKEYGIVERVAHGNSSLPWLKDLAVAYQSMGTLSPKLDNSPDNFLRMCKGLLEKNEGIRKIFDTRNPHNLPVSWGSSPPIALLAVWLRIFGGLSLAVKSAHVLPITCVVMQKL
jgi:hypothetical protein